MIPIVPRHQLAWRIRARFTGKLSPREYLTPNVWLKNPGWGDEIFNRVIERLDFFLPTGHAIVLSGMEHYNFFVEAAQSRLTKGGAEIVAFWFAGKLPGRDLVEMWRIGKGGAVRTRKPWGQEWGGGPTRGWKRGAVGSDIMSRIEG